MDDSDKGFFSSSTTIKPSAIPKFTATGGTDENDKNCDKLASKLHNPLKKPPIKHFMSPTISAASKISDLGKKILAERNEALNSTETHHSNTPNLDTKTSPLCRIDDEQNTCVSDSALAYDPQTNYLSPRPKFLRYNPNRRREIFFGQENYIGKEKDGSGIKSCFNSQRGFVKRENEGNETGKEKDEGSGVKSSVCLVSQRNIDNADKVPSSEQDTGKPEDEKIDEMNEDHQDDDSDEEIEEFEKENYAILKGVLKFLLVFVFLFFSTIYICSKNSPTPSPNPQALWGVKDGYQKFQNHTSEVMTDKIFEGRSQSLAQREETQFGGFEQEVTIEENKGLVESAYESVEVEIADKQVTQTENGKDGYEAELEREEEVSVGLPLEEKAESEEVLELSETEEQSESLEVEVEDRSEKIEVIFNEGAEKEVAESKMEERLEEGLTENGDGISQGEVDSVLGYLLVPVIAAFSLLGFRLWRKITSLPMEKQVSESVLAEKTTSVGPVVLPYVEEEHVQKVESFVNPSSLNRSTEETTKEFYQIRAPSVELLGEFVVGEASSSIKSCGMNRSKMVEIEVSSNSVSLEKGTGSKAHAFSSPATPSESEFSTMKSPSYGSFTAEKKIVKKEEGKEGDVKTVTATPVSKGGDVKMVTATPVRRSGRLRNRTVMSP